MTLVEYIPPREPSTVLQLNRVGSARGARDSYPDVWEHAVQTDDPRGLLDRLSALAGLPVIGHIPPSTPSVIVYRTIAALLTPAAFGRARCECRSGYSDTSGGPNEVQGEWFARFPNAQEKLRYRAPDDLLDVAAYRFWFLLRNHEPLLCLETTGRAWDRTGKEYDLAAAYQTSGHVWAFAGSIMAALY